MITLPVEVVAVPVREPGRGYSWPPFEPGHELSMKHGADSPRVVAPIAEQIRAELVATAPWCAGTPFAATVAAWSWSEAQAHLLRQYLDEHGLLDDEGEPRAASTRLDKVERRAQSLRQELGLSPLALGKLLAVLSRVDGKASAEGLASLEAAGRQVREQAEQRAMEAAAVAELPAPDPIPTDPTETEVDDAEA